MKLSPVTLFVEGFWNPEVLWGLGNVKSLTKSPAFLQKLGSGDSLLMTYETVPRDLICGRFLEPRSVMGFGKC